MSPVCDVWPGACMSESKPNILVVDDAAANRDLIRRRFERHGFEIVEADGGNRALELARLRSFDLLLLDVTMPDLNGLEVLRQIRQNPSTAALPVIMVTGKSESTHVAEAFAAGANDYVTKPIDFTVALARINAQLALKRAENAAREASDNLRRMNESLEQRISERTRELVDANFRLRNEIAERERSEAQTYYIAHHDALTGLGNRMLFRQQLNEILDRVRRTGESVAVLFVDLDGFKSINDSLGHSIGDGFLKCIAERLRANVCETDVIARLGGDEFAIVQTAKEQPQGAAALASRLIDVIGEPCIVDSHQLLAGASIGIAVRALDELDLDDLLRSADLAMYRAKSDGRGVYRFFEPEMDARVQARRLLETELRRALLNKSFELHYQPIFNLARGRITGLEALLRWQHPWRGLVPPAEFIALAEEIGLIIPLGEWVLQQACTEAARWPEDVFVSVNLSPVQFKYDGLTKAVSQALDAAGLPPNRLELEITESVLLDKTDSNVATLNELRDLGVRVSLDDFGTGYSGLSYLRTFRFDKIKVDQSFVRDLSEQSDSLAIVRAIADIGFSFGIATVAEGVETVEQMRRLIEEGYSEVQGYLFGEPRPASEICSLVAEQRETTREPPPLKRTRIGSP
jgi:diguanylate cyclase (GGDEF)-like protein